MRNRFSERSNAKWIWGSKDWNNIYKHQMNQWNSCSQSLADNKKSQKVKTAFFTTISNEMLAIWYIVKATYSNVFLPLSSSRCKAIKGLNRSKRSNQTCITESQIKPNSQQKNRKKYIYIIEFWHYNKDKLLEMRSLRTEISRCIGPPTIVSFL